MQQRFRRLAMFVGAASMVSGALLFAACGTDNGGTTSTSFDSSVNKPDTSKDPNSETGPGDIDTGIIDGGAPDCSEAPKLRTNTTAGGFFCAFYRADGGAGDGGLSSASNCSSTQTCCNPGRNDAGAFPPSFCANGKGGDTPCEAQDIANNSEFTPGFFSNSWECNDSTACPAGNVCVMITSAFSTGASPAVNVGKSTDKDIPVACMALQSFKQGGSRCKAAPAAGDIKLCSSSDMNCGTGTTCTAFSGSFRDLGYCR
jgi:hypothetical protein